MKKTQSDFEQRFEAFHGGKPLSAKVALQGIAVVERELIARFRGRIARSAEAAAYMREIQAPIYDVIAKDGRVAQGLRGFREANQRLGKRRITAPPCPNDKVSSRITSGSILSFASTPYDYEWAAVAKNGSGFSQGLGRKVDGTAVVYATGNSNGSADGAAGVGKYFRPISENAWVRVTPFVTYNYFWYDRSTYLTAHNDGFVGVYIQSFDLRGGDARLEVDVRSSLWSDGTSWFQDHSDEESGIVWAPSETAYFPATSNRQYVVWVWGNVSCDDNTNQLGSSYAVASLAIRVPWIVFEQWT